MILHNWLREFLEILDAHHERKEEIRICHSCEILKLQIVVLNDQNKMLVERLTTPIEKKEEEQKPPDGMPALPHRHVPWRVQAQMLQLREKEKAHQKKLAEDAPKPIQVITSESKIAEIEKELEDATGTNP